MDKKSLVYGSKKHLIIGFISIMKQKREKEEKGIHSQASDSGNVTTVSPAIYAPPKRLGDLTSYPAGSPSLGFWLPSITHLTILTSGKQVSSAGAAAMSPRPVAPWPRRGAAGGQQEVGGMPGTQQGRHQSLLLLNRSDEKTPGARRPSGTAPFPILAQRLTPYPVNKNP